MDTFQIALYTEGILLEDNKLNVEKVNRILRKIKEDNDMPYDNKTEIVDIIVTTIRKTPIIKADLHLVGEMHTLMYKISRDIRT